MLSPKLPVADHTGSGRPGRKRILLVDDEQSILLVTSHILEIKGYEVTCARDGAEGITRYVEAMKEGDPFAAVIMDLIIPHGLGGKETITLMSGIDPDVRAIVSSGYSDDPVMADFRGYGFLGILPKPYRIQDLYREVTRVITGTSTDFVA
jgi:CheY-like chemotaxis protein